jgi:hypothetical protein
VKIVAMRVLETDIDLILFALTTLLIVGGAEPPSQPSVEVPTICVETACYPVPLVLP